MKLSLSLLGLCHAADLSTLPQQVTALANQIDTLQTHESFSQEVEIAVTADRKSHNKVKSKLERSALPRGEHCSLHWSLCPNMCQIDYELEYKFDEIRGTKMQQYETFSDEMREKRDEIVHDLKGKADQVYDWEANLNKGQLDLEREEDAFILELQNDLKQAQIVNDGLKELDDGYADLTGEFTALSIKIGKAHASCEDQAPCMAVPVCKLHAASGKSCADIVNKNMDTVDGVQTNHAESGYYLIAPAGLEPKTAICENDQMGGSFTVIQNRINGSESFDRNWNDYKNGFGTTVNLDSAQCDEGEFWLGNEYIYAVQDKRARNALNIKMARHDGTEGQVGYSNFKIAAERQKYQLQKADGFKEDECGQKVGNSLAGMNFGAQGYGEKDIAKTVHVGMKFSTPDQDNDMNRRSSCAQQDRSGWWFNSCSAANLNGFYHGGKYTAEETRTGEFDDGVLWNTWTNDKFEALTKTRMSLGQDKGYNGRICSADPTTQTVTDSFPVTERGDDSDESSYYDYY